MRSSTRARVVVDGLGKRNLAQRTERRNATMVRRYEDGETLTAIAEAFRLTRERAARSRGGHRGVNTPIRMVEFVFTVVVPRKGLDGADCTVVHGDAPEYEVATR